MTGHIMRIDFTRCMATSDNEPIAGTDEDLVLLYNASVISEKEVDKLLTTGGYQNDERVVILTPKQADYLSGKAD